MATEAWHPPCLDKCFISPALAALFKLRRESGTVSRQASAVAMFEEMAIDALQADNSAESVRLFSKLDCTAY